MIDPYQVLGVARNADDASIRAAYLAAIRTCPPDRDADRFAQLRKAFDAISTHQRRLTHDLFYRVPPTVHGVFQLIHDEFVPRRPDAATLLGLLKARSDGR